VFCDRGVYGRLIKEGWFRRGFVLARLAVVMQVLAPTSMHLTPEFRTPSRWGQVPVLQHDYPPDVLPGSVWRPYANRLRLHVIPVESLVPPAPVDILWLKDRAGHTSRSALCGLHAVIYLIANSSHFKRPGRPATPR